MFHFLVSKIATTRTVFSVMSLWSSITFSRTMCLVVRRGAGMAPIIVLGPGMERSKSSLLAVSGFLLQMSSFRPQQPAAASAMRLIGDG